MALDTEDNKLAGAAGKRTLSVTLQMGPDIVTYKDTDTKRHIQIYRDRYTDTDTDKIYNNFFF